MKRVYKFVVIAAIALPFGLGVAVAQNKGNTSSAAVTRTQLPAIPRSGVAEMRMQVEDWDPFFKTVQKMPTPGLDARKDEVDRLKAEANKVHEALIASGAAGSEAAKVTVTTPPTLGVNFVGNTYGGGDPADNTIAISADGQMITGSNTRFHTYNSSGTQTSGMSFTAFANAGGVSTNFTFDPKCTYDPDADRFVLAFLNGGTANSSKVIVAFSQTNDPAGAWNVYAINGNVNGMGVWTDFVQIGLNQNEVFVSGNPFTDAGSSQGAAVWQINKADGYSGAAITPVLHYVSSGFSVHPVQGGATLYGPHMYFLQSELGSSNNITLYKISNSIANNGTMGSPAVFTMNNSYTISPVADQRGTTVNLKTNDTRVQSSYYENSRIEFVLNSSVNGMAGVFHGTGFISPIPSFTSFTSQLLGYTDLDIAYPSIAYAGQQDVSGFNQSYISFLTSGPSHYPGMAAVYADETGYSGRTIIKEGVNFINSADNRWGDYAGLEERAGHPGEVWACGTFGNSSLQQRTYIGQLLPPVPVGVAPTLPTAVKMEVSPNPATEIVKFDFPVEELGVYKVVVRDLQGKTVKEILEDKLVAGTARLTFNAQYLPSGTYIVSVENASKVLFTDKLVINH